jgi:hypothetical protein
MSITGRRLDLEEQTYGIAQKVLISFQSGGSTQPIPHSSSPARRSRVVPSNTNTNMTRPRGNQSRHQRSESWGSDNSSGSKKSAPSSSASSSSFANRDKPPHYSSPFDPSSALQIEVPVEALIDMELRAAQDPDLVEKAETRDKRNRAAWGWLRNEKREAEKKLQQSVRNKQVAREMEQKGAEESIEEWSRGGRIERRRM